MANDSVGAAVATSSDGDLLGACLHAARGFDEVVLFDLESADDSVKIAVEHGARIVRHPHVPFVELIRQRQLEEAATDWVMFLDPDEVLPDGWLDDVRRILRTTPSDVAGFWIELRDVAFGTRLEYTRRGAAKVSLVRRRAARARPAAEVRPHDMLFLDGRIGSMVGGVAPIDHYAYRSVRQSIEKLSRYASGGGVGVDVADATPGPLTCIKMLWGDVVMSRSWRDGTPGVAVASLSVIGDYLGLLERWDEAGRPAGRVSAREEILLEAARFAHRAQWKLRTHFHRNKHR